MQIVLLTSGDSFPHLIQKRRSQLGFVAYLLNYPRRTPHVSDIFSVHHQESSTVHTAIGVYHTGYADCFIASSQHNRYDKYEVRKFNFLNSRWVSLGCWVRQAHVLKHVWACSALRLNEPQTKWVVRSRAAEEVVRVRGIRLAEKCVRQESGIANKHQVLCEDW
jgi:hypothetical protein